MTAPAYVVIEQFTHVTPFGLGLWDVVTSALVSEGLSVRIRALAGTAVASTTIATATRSGLFAAHDLQRLRAFESGNEGLEAWAIPSPPRPHFIEVRDTVGRFLPFALHLLLPTRGLALPPCADALWPIELSSPLGMSPAAAVMPSYVPLFSTPARTAPAGRATVRARILVDGASGAPAAWAVLELRHAGRLLARGIADARGEVAAMFAYPEPPDPPPTSPSGGTAPTIPLSRQSWPIEITVRYGAELPTYPVGARDAVPDLCDVLQQPTTAVFTSSPLAPLTEATLRYGEALVLGAPSGAELFIRPA